VLQPLKPILGKELVRLRDMAMHRYTVAEGMTEGMQKN
jgi:hypothetical protein